jgi:hypothetical protein
MITKFKLFESLNENFYKWFGKSKVVDEKGEPLIVYHGSPAIFKEFNHDLIGKHKGTSEGFGFYFTNNKNVAKGYNKDGGKLYEVYLKIEKPLGFTKKTITKIQLSKFIKEFDPTGQDYLSNYGDVEYDGYNKVLRDAIENEYNHNDNDVDLIDGILTAAGGRYKKGFLALYKSLGYDGIIISEPSWEDQKLYVAFFSNHIKSKDSVNFNINSLDINESITNTNYNKFPLNALIKQARNFKDFKDFSTFYCVEIYHGYYWHLTNNPNFTISEETDPRDMSSMSDGGITQKGAIMLTSHLEYWDEHYNTNSDTEKRDIKRNYVVLFDASDIEPKYLKQIGRGFGNEIYLNKDQAKKLKQIGIYNLKYAKALDKKFHNLIPSSEKELYKLWKNANNTLLKENISIKVDIKTLKQELAKAAQKVYDEWEQDENYLDPILGSGGICQDIAEAMCDVLNNNDIECVSVSQEIGEQHVYVVAKTEDGIFNVDIPPYLYETGGGYNWKKIPNVEFDESYITIDRISSDPNDFNDYLEY